MLTATNGRLVITASTPRKLAVKAWRIGGFGRLYWKSHNRRWRWDSEVVARARDGTAGMDFFTLNAVLEAAGFEMVAAA